MEGGRRIHEPHIGHEKMDANLYAKVFRQWLTCQRPTSTVSLFNFLTTLNIFLLVHIH